MPSEYKTFSSVAALIPTYGVIFSAFFKVLEFADNFGREDPVATALAKLQGQISQLKADVAGLNLRINDIQLQVIRNENAARVDRLADIVDRVERIQFELALKPKAANTRALIAFDAGQLCEIFLDDFDVWAWTDIQTIHHFDDYGVELDPEISAMTPDFKTYPALPVYLAAVTTWLLAIDFHTGGNYAITQKHYGPALRRHIASVARREEWAELEHPPETFSEHIAKRITCFPQAIDRYAKNGECRFSIICDNVIDRTISSLDGSDYSTPAEDGSLCMANPNAGAGWEHDIEDQRGVTALSELDVVLRRVESTGSLRPPFVGRFDTTPYYNQAYIYVVKENGEVFWWKQRPSKTAGSLSGWDGPSSVGYGWGEYLAVLPAGGNNFYVLRPDGVLLWYQHEGFSDGTFKWRGPTDIGATGWNGFTQIVPGSDGVLYAISSDGTMNWYRHEGVRGLGTKSWLGPVGQRAGWEQYQTVFSGGMGVLYGVRNDGVLHWFKHNGFQDGGNYWEGPRTVGSGWQDFSSVFGIGNGIVYATSPDGALMWLRHRGWKTGGPEGTWDSAIVVAESGWTGFRHIFPLMLATPAGIK